MFDKPSLTSRLFGLLSGLVVLFGLAVVLGWAAWGGFSLYQGTIDSSGLFLRLGLPCLLFPVLVFSLRTGLENRLVAALCILASIGSLYLAEAYLEYQNDRARLLRSDVDRRSKIDVIMQLRGQGIEAYPVMRAKTLLEPAPDGKLRSELGDDGFLPLASLPGSRVVSCNESGQWLVYDSDRHGFNNPDKAWDRAPPTALLLGDSFAHGSCVPQDRSIAADLIRGRIPAISLGVSGFGPLSMLAALREYGAALHPPYVFWLFFEGNDLTEDLPFERNAPALTAYLDEPLHRQNLIGRSGEVSERLKAYLDRKLIEAMARFDNPQEKLLDFLQLYHLRERFGLGALSLGLAGHAELNEQAAYFERVLSQADRDAQAWGGRLVFVYLPESARFFAARQNGKLRLRLHDLALGAARKLDLPVIDIAGSFAQDTDPARFFVYPGSHYNEAGYERVAREIEDFLHERKERGELPRRAP